MTKPRHQDPLLPHQDQLFRAMGLGRTKMRIVYGALGFLTVGIVAQGVERWWITRQLETQVYVVTTDQMGNIAEVRRAAAVWQPEDGLWINEAMHWVRAVRARPSDPVAWRWQAEQIKSTTAQELFTSLSDWIVRSNDELRGKSVEVEILETTLVGQPMPDSATVFVRWRERGMKGGSAPGDWTRLSATVTLRRKAPEDPREVTANPIGVYVTSYSFQVEPERRADAR